MVVEKFSILSSQQFFSRALKKSIDIGRGGYYGKLMWWYCACLRILPPRTLLPSPLYYMAPLPHLQPMIGLS